MRSNSLPKLVIDSLWAGFAEKHDVLSHSHSPPAHKGRVFLLLHSIRGGVASNSLFRTYILNGRNESIVSSHQPARSIQESRGRDVSRVCGHPQSYQPQHRRDYRPMRLCLLTDRTPSDVFPTSRFPRRNSRSTTDSPTSTTAMSRRFRFWCEKGADVSHRRRRCIRCTASTRR